MYNKIQFDHLRITTIYSQSILHIAIVYVVPVLHYSHGWGLEDSPAKNQSMTSRFQCSCSDQAAYQIYHNTSLQRATWQHQHSTTHLPHWTLCHNPRLCHGRVWTCHSVCHHHLQDNSDNIQQTLLPSHFAEDRLQIEYSNVLGAAQNDAVED